MKAGNNSRGAKELGAAIRVLFSEGQTDYGLEPVILANDEGQPIGRIQDGDAVIFCCRRGEREIQLTEAFTEPDFPHFLRPKFDTLPFVILTLYHEKFKDLPVAFAPSRIAETLGELVSKAGLRQLRTSESEKFAHITFFLNGGNNQPFPGEEGVRIPSPRGVPFDQVPGLSLEQVTAQVVEGIRQNYDLIVTNFANGDVIGHTANREAKLKCAEIVDASLGKVVDAAVAADYVVLITADHGNLEEMFTAEGAPHVSHTANPVQFILIDPRAAAGADLRAGKLADVAPTVLAALGLKQSASMSGEDLAPGYAWNGKRRVLLVILDGWGIGRQDEGNPIHVSATPVWDKLLECYPCCQLQASGDFVGLGAGKPGNSEAGHMNIGAGRVVLQDDVRLDAAVQDGSFFTNEVFCSTIDGVRRRGGSLHLIGLLTEKSSHGSMEYPLALLQIAKSAGLEKAFLHMILDGRSTEPGSAPALLDKLETKMNQIGLGRIVSVIGRGIALDRDGNYAKTKRAFDAFVFGVGRSAGEGKA